MPETYPGARALRRPSGHILLDGSQVADTYQCAHCGGHWVAQVGSGVLRGYCTMCDGYVCGKPSCHECRPAERRLEIAEAAAVIP